MKKAKYIPLVFIVALLIGVFGCSENNTGKETPSEKKMQNTTQTDKFSFYRMNESDQVLYDYLLESHKTIEDFFGEHFDRRFEVAVYPDRKSLDRQIAREKKDSTFKSDCSQIAFPNALRLYLLSPDAWEKESCTKIPTKKEAVKKLILGELVHIFHSQYNFSPDVCKTTEIRWFAQGLELYVTEGINSGDYEINSGINRLADLDSIGAAFFAEFIDLNYGRQKLFYILQFSSGEQIAETLEKTEAGLLSDLQNYIKKRK
ncbi:MAG: hypothetical protein A2W91_11720 [Bacteroidetes bacterium GWF2_38_335]|nr:MAG: hypothetical protein A2W91_11720 [Bacteroidetes bacterium GWF2_38_335]OFY77947.1 MAG: hypothetical protein A2281_18465 [Bacteroidetes bacterium RIFOXYA12_FULL_38_20]HBS86688.1 hypothetical protein [Bacteroidales bacterium]